MKNLNNQAFKYVWDELDDKLWNQVIGQIRSQVWAQLGEKVSNQVSRLKPSRKL